MKLVRFYYQGGDDEGLDIASLDLHPDLLQLLAELGVVELMGNRISRRELKRIRQLQRLREYLGVNVIGAAIIIDLLERIEALEDELDRYRAR